MRVFVTGATGFIGSAVVRELIATGHTVLGLVRSDASADALARLGGEAHRGNLTDHDSLATGARACDGVIHLAFDLDAGHGADSFAIGLAADRSAIAALGDSLADSGRPFVGTSGTLTLTPGRLGTEDDAGDPASVGGFRVPAENAALALATRGVRASVVRAAPSVHGAGEHGFIPGLIRTAREKGVSAYVGDGMNRWPAVHRIDAARLFTLALERGDPGARYHAVADEGIPFRNIAAVIGRRLNVPVASITPEQAPGHFGPYAFVVSVDNPAVSTRTRQQLGWHPAQPGLLADLEESHYFAG